MMLLREAKTEDVKTIFNLEKILFQEGSYPVFVLRQLFEISPGLTIVAEVEGKMVGYIQGNFVAEKLAGWVLSVGILSSHQGKQIGEKLMSSILTNLTRRGANQVFLTVHPDNAPALKLYQKLGFVEEHREEDYYFTGSPRVRMIWRV